MKKLSITLISLLLITGLYSCDDFLDVSSDSKYTEDYIFSDEEEINRLLNTLYMQLMSGNTYGGKYLTTYSLNSDVEFTAYSSDLQSTSGNDYKNFDATRMGSDLASTWTDAYEGIEYANIFVNGLEKSPLYNTNNAALMQKMGEAKVIRAMFYHDLVVLFGDIPFSFTDSYDAEGLVMPVVDRETILTTLINDLIEIAPHMSFAKDLSEGVERVSKEFCWSMIARMALTRGGYSLHPDKSNPMNVGTMTRSDDYMDYYKIAMEYADSVITSGTHNLKKSFRQVFIDECNYIVTNDDDPIFEIPFLRESSGSVGYYHGPKGETLNDVSQGLNVWGASNGGLRLNAFYRYSFDRKDLRLDYTVGMWYYLYDGTPNILSDYSTFCNKWSKFWATPGNAMGVESGGNTGINYPYMRYADVLLMYAEAVNEVEDGVNGPNGQKAIDAFKQVRSRAFASEDQGEKVEQYIASASASKQSFFEAIANERKWEFGGENMRWKDLVRWNMYSQVVYDSFMEYYTVAMVVGGDNSLDEEGKYDTLPIQMFYKVAPNPGDINKYPNTTLDVLEILNPYQNMQNPGGDWEMADCYAWYDDDLSTPKGQCLNSFRGYIRADQYGNFIPSLDPNNLPPVRYILPFPNTAIQRGAGAYQNYYGYN